jgi:hypothetical protein
VAHYARFLNSVKFITGDWRRTRRQLRRPQSCTIHVLTRDRVEKCIFNGNHRSLEVRKLRGCPLRNSPYSVWGGLTFPGFGKGLKNQSQRIETLGRNPVPKRTQVSLLTTWHSHTKAHKRAQASKASCIRAHKRTPELKGKDYSSQYPEGQLHLSQPTGTLLDLVPSALVCLCTLGVNTPCTCTTRTIDNRAHTYSVS